MSKFPVFRQLDQKDCGASCLKMIFEHYGKNISITKIRDRSETTRSGTSLFQLSRTADFFGFRSVPVSITLDDLISKAPLPCIIHWNQNHFVVVYKVSGNSFYLADPAIGRRKVSKQEFINSWIVETEEGSKMEGIALVLEPTNDFDEVIEDGEERRLKLGFLWQYVRRYKSLVFQLILGLLFAGLLQLVVPFLTQSIVDVGVQQRNISFIYLILVAQLALFFGRTLIELIRGWIVLHLSARIRISLVSDFFVKLMRLPISYFDSKLTGDILQRIGDHKRLESLITVSSLNIIFSFFTLIILGSVLAYYSLTIFFIFALGSTLYALWILLFLRKRKKLDYERFDKLSSEQSTVIELITGMQEIKLHNAERKFRWNWENLQSDLFKIDIKFLKLQQIQSSGGSVLNEVKNILITVISASLVIEGSITLGMMLSITYIVGQLNSPIGQLVNFAYTLQDARIALERLSEIHTVQSAENEGSSMYSQPLESNDIRIENLSFRYPAAKEMTINNLSLTIESNSKTAIVGSSGSGKTTLMRLIMQFYDLDAGAILVGKRNLNSISNTIWRDKCGVVMQDGQIFNNTVASNIALGEDRVDFERLKNACYIANINTFIEDLPLGYETVIGNEGLGLSGGQKQRILIARAIYKNPEIILFDEATSALDSTNERIIVERLDSFFESKTAIIIAHRLSTVKSADKIVVLEHGEIVEQGNHEELISKQGVYFQLVKNQLQLEQINNAK